MNYQRILSVANGYFILTGYQLRTLDSKSNRYRLKLWAVLHFILLFVWYLICFEHHFEKSAFMKIMLDLSPFLKNLIIVQIWLGLKAFIFCIIEWRSLTSVLNGLMEIVMARKDVPQKRSDIINEVVAYCLLFATILVSFCIGLYIAIEMKFELPPMDNIMIAMALLMPHLALAGSLRLYVLCLWMIRKKLQNLKDLINPQVAKVDQDIVIDVIKPVIQNDVTPEMDQKSATSKIYLETWEDLKSISNYLKSANAILQRQLCVLNGLNFNCLLYGVFTRLYFDNTWNVIFIGSKRRIFYASNTGIFICIYLDYALLLLVQFAFNKMKHDFGSDVGNMIDGSTNTDTKKSVILKKIRRILKEKLNLKLFGLMDFSLWNFLVVQILMLLIIAIIVLYQYLNDQLAALSEQIESIDTE